MADSNSNQWFGVSMVLVGVIAGYGVAMSGGGAPAPSAPTAAVAPSPTPSAPPAAPEAKDVKPVDLKRDHIRGNRKANIALIEYSDYECPFCGRHHPTAQGLIDANDDVMWVYRHFPLGFHQNATPLAEASECAWEQGGDDAFWKFTDLIFEKGADAANIAQYGDESGVDGAKVQDCVDAGTYAQYVQDDMASGSAGGVSGTPGNIVLNIKTGDSRLVSGAQPLASFQAAVDALR
ncbi:MAG: thioredoxin domain-containing protein [Candidatus Peribacteraceae bacterium]|nr:thioredoxin domain-containing protein [Candidatus Peribacteraceae bacterium]|tara:strand:- start:9669 stop:10373 length:705 start_codon:yes stop_codon:yes gene_type:complete